MTKPLKLGIPKGSLQDSTTRLFGRAGWRINVNGRSYFPEIDDDGIECSICRAQEMSRYVESGTLDAGITGMDWIKENDSEVVYVEELVYSKVSTRPARWVLAVAKDSPIKRPEDLGGMRVATEMVNFTKRYFEEAGIDVTV
ncbi:MAG: ATP phosphoribosyltransferase, partial [Proteobacteria bacterium]|nr:ATP phosphoribosyltransferase [Pseudomonadota bacterium]